MAAAKEKLSWVPEIIVQEKCVEKVVIDLAQSKKNVLLKQYGYSFNVGVEWVIGAVILEGSLG